MAPTTDLPTASIAETAAVLATAVLPTVAKGAVIRRPRAVGLGQRLDADTRAVRTLRRMRERHGPDPLVLPIPGRRMAFVLDADDVHRVLNGSPEPFRLDTREKRGALQHFQPEGVLVSTPEERTARRPFNEAVLETGAPIHHLAPAMTAAVEQECAQLLGSVERTGVLEWHDFAAAWMRVVRRVVLGDGARDDEETTDLLQRLRKDANWTALKPTRDATRRRFLARLQDHVARAEAGSLAEVVASTPAAPGTEKHQQIPQWLFAFDAVTWASFRALALLHTQPGAPERAEQDWPGRPDLPYLRAAVLESLRLWPTTPAILRETTEDTTWREGTLPAGTSVVVYAPLFHRDDTTLAEAHRFAPELWLRERTDDDWPLVPFSGGPGMCPGRNVVLLTASVLLGCLSTGRRFAVEGADLPPGGPLPGTVSPFGLRFRLVGPDGAR
jgi:cytochrome P450